MTMPLATPPMLFPVIQHHVEKLLTGEFVLQLGIDLEGLMATGRRVGLPMKWLTKKQSREIVNSEVWRETGLRSNEIYIWNDRAIAIYEDAEQNVMGTGILGRILFGPSRPSSVLHMLTHRLKMQPE